MNFSELTKVDQELAIKVFKEAAYYMEYHHDTGELFNADENCNHITASGMNGGVKCIRCGGWFCY